jgi:hypothetical protein
MKREIDIEQLLRWRFERAEAGAPFAPSAAHLLEIVRPWWEMWPERFQAYTRQVGAIRISYGYAMSELHHGHTGYPVPTLIARGNEELEAPARVLYMTVRDGRLRLRFQIDPIPTPDRSFDVTFLSEAGLRPILSANAELSVDGEYRLDVELPEELATMWESLRVTDQMPFRFILRPTVTTS